MVTRWANPTHTNHSRLWAAIPVWNVEHEAQIKQSGQPEPMVWGPDMPQISHYWDWDHHDELLPVWKLDQNVKRHLKPLFFIHKGFLQFLFMYCFFKHTECICWHNPEGIYVPFIAQTREILLDSHTCKKIKLQNSSTTWPQREKKNSNYL